METTSWRVHSLPRLSDLSRPAPVLTPASFQNGYNYIWNRDFPLLQAMGANTLVIYGWNNTVSHKQFLDTAYQ
jgi:hypothetical protein